jgi:hypothetical protein
MNTVKFIGMDVHKKTITIAIIDPGVKSNPGFMVPLPINPRRWINSVVKWFPLQPGCILSMKPAPVVTAFIVI